MLTFFLLLFIEAPSDAASGRFGATFLLFDSLSQTGFLSCEILLVDLDFRLEDNAPF